MPNNYCVILELFLSKIFIFYVYSVSIFDITCYNIYSFLFEIDILIYFTFKNKVKINFEKNEY